MNRRRPQSHRYLRLRDVIGDLLVLGLVVGGIVAAFEALFGR